MRPSPDALFTATKTKGSSLYIYQRKTGKLETAAWASADEIVLGGLVITVPIWLLLLIIPVTRIYQEGGLLGVLFGVIGGGALGGLFGALAGSDHGDYVNLLRRMGVPAAQAEKFYAGMKGGHVMVIARDPSGTRADEALSLMRKHGAVKLEDAVGSGQLQSERH